jgi:3-dehydroquinate synthase
MRRVEVTVRPPYHVEIGPDALGTLMDLVGDRTYVVVTQREVLDAQGRVLKGALDRVDPWIETMESGEIAKSFVTADQLCRRFAAGGLPRDGVVIAIGGGVVGDTAGFAASVYHRGVAVIQVATTLLAQVDAAIGGKTAVNLPEGKNLVGAFHQPLGVLADTTTLSTLPDAEFRSGLGEVAKYALMPQGAAVARVVDEQRSGVLARDPDTLEELVAACVDIKAQVVGEDPEEHTGVRATLNFGHTFAHALETVFGYTISHGEAVSIGLVFANGLARALDRIDDAAVTRASEILRAFELPVAVPAEAGVPASVLVDAMHRDKKASGGLTFVLPGPNGLELVHDPPPAALDEALRTVGIDPAGVDPAGVDPAGGRG